MVNATTNAEKSSDKAEKEKGVSEQLEMLVEKFGVDEQQKSGSADVLILISISPV